MRILHVLDYSPPFPGGIVHHLSALGRALHARGDQLIVAFPRERPWLRDVGDGVETLIVPQIRRPTRSGFARAFEKIRRERRIDLAHLSFSFALPFALACGWTRPRVPIVFHWHNPPRLLLPPPQARRVPGGTIEGTAGSVDARTAGGVAARTAGGLAARFTDGRAVDAHVVVSRDIRDRLLAHGWARPEKIFHLPNALPLIPDDAGANPESAAGREGVIIGSIAGFRPQKDHETLLRAFALLLREHPTPRLILVGDGPTRVAAEELARRLGLEDRVAFPGSLSDPAAAYAKMDIFVLSTRFEGQGLVLLEAMARALPVVATDLPVIRETVRDRVDGLLAAPGDPGALAAALARLVREPPLRRALGRSGRARALADFPMANWTTRLLDLYDQLIGRLPGRSSGQVIDRSPRPSLGSAGR